MSLMESLNDNRTKVPIVPSPTTKKGKRKREEGRRYRELGNGVFRERLSHFSLDFYGRSDRRNPSGQEGKLLYAERPTRGLQF